MSYVVDEAAGEVVGWSLWPWDGLYAPVVGLFVHGRLEAHTVCDQGRPQVRPQRFARARFFLRRVRRKLLGTPIASLAPPLEGPDARCWFRLSAEAELLQALAREAAHVRLSRLEDGAILRAARPAAVDATGDPAAADAPTTVEALLARDTDVESPALDGFPTFLTEPLAHQLDVLFVELLRRLPDPPARRAYLAQLEGGELGILDLRRDIMRSGEFAARRIGLHDRVGALVTSSLWRELARWETPGAVRRTLTPFRLADHDDRDDAGFVDAAYLEMLRRPADPIGRAHYAAAAAAQGGKDGRRDVAVELARFAAADGRFFDVI